MYALVARFFGMALDLFYKRRHLGGEVPKTGAVVIVANHPNGLLDPAAVLRIAGRQVRFLAKEPIFRMPVLDQILKVLKALPIYRAQDGHDTSANRGTFDAVFGSLVDGDCICLFPEGISHSEPELQPLKTGAARMALGAEARGDFAVGVRVVPVGLNFRDKTVFRSELAVQVGEALECGDLAELHGSDPKAAARQLTERIDEAIRALTVNMEAWADAPLLELAGRVWAPEDDPIRALRAAAAGQRDFLEQAPEATEALRHRVEELHEALSDLDLDPADLDRRYPLGGVLRFAGRNLFALLVGLPIALVGGLAYAAPYHLVKLPVALMKPTPDVVATTKFLGGVLFFGAWQIGLTVALVAWLGPWGALPAIALPFCGVYTNRFLERRQAAWRATRVFMRLPSRKSALAELRAQRDAIRRDIEALAQG